MIPFPRLRCSLILGLLCLALGRPELVRAQRSDMDLRAALREAADAKDSLKVAGLARQILARDPLVPSQISMIIGSRLTLVDPNGFGPPNYQPDYLRSDALQDLKKLDLLDDYIVETLQKLDADPRSWRLEWQLGEAYAAAAEPTRELRFLLPGPHWLKVTRQGTEFTAFSSTNGTDWTTVGHTSEVVGPALLVGLWVPGSTSSKPVVGSFEHFAIKPSVPAAAIVTPVCLESDLGGPATAAGFMIPGPDPDGFVVTGPLGRANLATGHFVYRPLDGDGSVEVRLPDLEPLREDDRIGLMLRASLDPSSPAVRLEASRRRGFELGYTREPGQWVGDPKGGIPLPGWLKLARTGDQLTASYSTNGTDWLPVFSRRLDLGSGALAGVIARGGGATASFSWSGLSVHGADINLPPAAANVAAVPEALPVPWQFAAIGDQATGSEAHWKDDKIVLTVGARPSASPAKYFLNRPLAGDGEVLAFEPSGQRVDYPGFDVLALRSSTAGTDSEVRFGTLGEDGILEFNVERAGRKEAAEYFTRAAASGPPKPQLVLAAAAFDMQNDHPSDAADVFVRLFRADPEAAMTIAVDVGGAFEKSGRIAELAGLVETLSPPIGPTPGTGLAGLVTTLGDRTQKYHPAESARFLRKAVELAGGPADLGSVLGLVVRLQMAGQREAAASLLAKWYAVDPAPRAAILGGDKTYHWEIFNPNSYGTSDDSFTMPTTVDLLTMALDLGLGAKLRAAIDRRDRSGEATDQRLAATNAVFSILLRIEARDPLYRAELDQFLSAGQEELLPQAGVIPMAMLAQELARWPTERLKAIEVLAADLDNAKTLGHGPGGMFTRMEPFIARQSAELGARLGDPTSVTSGLALAVDALKNNLSSPGTGGEAKAVFHDLIAAGLLSQADDLIQAIRSAPPEPHFGRPVMDDRQIQALQDELDEARKIPPGQAAVVDKAAVALHQAVGPPASLSPSVSNLLPNPGFAAERDSAGFMAVPGWKMLRPGRIVRESGGPDPATGYVTLVPLVGASESPFETRVESVPIHLPVGKDGFLFTGWTTGVNNLSFSFLGADQKPLCQPTKIPVPKGTKDSWNRHALRLALASAHGAAPDVVIPSGAAYLVLGLATNQEFKVAALRLEAASP